MNDRVFTKCLIAALMATTLASSTEAQAAGIQMLPPTDFSGNACTGTTGGLLQWDGSTSIKCVSGTAGTSNGFVGIGTASPADQLHVYSTVSTLSGIDQVVIEGQILVTSLHSSGSIHCGGGARSAITSFAEARIVRFTLRMMPMPSDHRFNLAEPNPFLRSRERYCGQAGRYWFGFFAPALTDARATISHYARFYRRGARRQNRTPSPLRATPTTAGRFARSVSVAERASRLPARRPQNPKGHSMIQKYNS
jgi:hypothetical protein